MFRWKNILVLLVSLWLPVQGYGAVAMPFCAHGTGTDGVADSGDGHPRHNGHQAQAGHGVAHGDLAPADHHATGHHGAGPGGDAQTAGDRTANLDCNDCGACHLACAPALISPATALPHRNATVFGLPKAQPLLSVTPERLQRPPLSALA